MTRWTKIFRKIQPAKWLRSKLITWLGIDEAIQLAVNAESYAKAINQEIMESQRVMIDLGARKGSTTIIVASQLNGGRVWVMHPEFDSLKHLQEFMDSRFPGWRRDRGRNDHHRIFDVPYGMEVDSLW